MKIECSRQLSDRQTDRQRLPLTGLLLEPKNLLDYNFDFEMIPNRYTTWGLKSYFILCEGGGCSLKGLGAGC